MAGFALILSLLALIAANTVRQILTAVLPDPEDAP